VVCCANVDSMAASRLTDGQKQELVDRYRQGETAQALAQVYGCSPNTVSRVLKAALDPAEMAALKKQPRSRGGATSEAAIEAVAGDPASDALPLASMDEPDPVAAEVISASAVNAGADAPQTEPAPESEDGIEADADPDDAAVLAIDDADDFAEDDLDDGDDDGEAGEVFVAVPVVHRAAVAPRPLHSGALPASVYLLVDKTVELEARPLREFPELGALPEDEQGRQALMLYANPRQAKRQCGRSQRVIKVPDSGVLERTSRYLLAQGITRLVLEGGDLFAIPGG